METTWPTWTATRQYVLRAYSGFQQQDSIRFRKTPMKADWWQATIEGFRVFFEPLEETCKPILQPKQEVA